jgi:predicted nucleic acid-binding Zn ribbon protein
MNKEWQRKASLRQVIALIVIAVVIGVFLWPYVRR